MQMFGALLNDLSKAFDCFSHDLVRARLNAYRLPKLSNQITKKDQNKLRFPLLGRNLFLWYLMDQHLGLLLHFSVLFNFHNEWD